MPLSLRIETRQKCFCVRDRVDMSIIHRYTSSTVTSRAKCTDVRCWQTQEIDEGGTAIFYIQAFPSFLRPITQLIRAEVYKAISAAK